MKGVAMADKVPEWKQISDQQHAKAADRETKLRAARMARDAAMPPPPPPAPKRARKKAAPKAKTAAVETESSAN
jgi:hypothetical protein